jgi:hypothetical protein
MRKLKGDIKNFSTNNTETITYSKVSKNPDLYVIISMKTNAK